MKLKKWLKYLDPIVDICIYTDKSPDDKPVFEGNPWDIPKKYKNMKIGRPHGDNDEEPIFITHFTNWNGVILERVTINLLEK